MTKKEISEYLAKIGAKGGKTGGLTTGQAKVRGDAAHYKRLAAKAAKARKANAGK